jgi:hypothetical protein
MDQYYTSQTYYDRPSRSGGGDEDWFALGALLVIGIVALLAKIIGVEKERARVERLDREHQQMRADIQSGRWRNQ